MVGSAMTDTPLTPEEIAELERKVKRVIYCPHCGNRHLDARWYAYNPHKKHHCRFKACRAKKLAFWTKVACIGVRTGDNEPVFKEAAPSS